MWVDAKEINLGSITVSSLLMMYVGGKWGIKCSYT